ncbi:hypothetical protein FPSE_03920 [Fusarium pseudograminearum CS3096]|uniref:Uncharacterized protein n=1 Tax=Fusarium pseudograminearum (strain CS3096) TaxID=1028729 RepID=K3W1E1_FUSPC|nr:hypothetical protein FPSE_03920 [Fusarium pseudograminearum CS3096]EKJ75740.1 hypothetical protein FPSE_03920 [Fusarium pseudograminearum CS3096]
MFLALDSSPTVRLIKAQFAAVVVAGPLYRLTLTNGVHTRAAAIEIVFNCFHGYRRSLARHGSSWLRLGLAKYSIFRQARRITLMQGPLDGIVDISEEASDKVRVCVAEILKELAALGMDIPANAAVPWERQEMTADEQCQIYWHLLRAYMHQVTLCRNPPSDCEAEHGNPAINLLKSGTPCSLASDISAELLNIKSLIETSKAEMVYGISHRLTRVSHDKVDMGDWLMIPSDVIESWETDTGLSLQTVVSSRAQ